MKQKYLISLTRHRHVLTYKKEYKTIQLRISKSITE